MRKTQKLDSIQAGLECVLAMAGSTLTIGAPLGVGKPNVLLNAFWRYASEHPEFECHIFTALSLGLPKAGSLLEKRFLVPFLNHHFGADYPELAYIKDVKADTLPANADVAEFYMQSGAYLGKAAAQRLYTSSNYTHAARDMADRGVNVIVQLVAHEHREGRDYYSFGSNPDTTQDLLDILARRNAPRPLMVGVVNKNMPFMDGKAEREEDFFDLIIDDKQAQHPLFAPPIASVNLVDHAIGLHASTLIADGGTLQIGIGSLSDALVHSLILRHQDSSAYQQLLEDCGLRGQQFDIEATDLGPFEQGLYAASEMFMDGFMHLYKAGILKRMVWPDAAVQSVLNEQQLEPVVSADLFNSLCDSGGLPLLLDEEQLVRLQTLGIVRPTITASADGWLCPDGQVLGLDIRDPEQRQAIIDKALNSGQPLKAGCVLHAAFFLGSKGFYHWLGQLDQQERQLFQMTSVSQINELYGGEDLDRAQRIKARFVNTTMKVTLLGAAASDGLDNNQVVSGVGGQYNFVAMAHALPDSRSILMLRSCHGSGARAQSNIVWTYPYDTIPRHLRDVVITEYGIALLRGKSDEDCIKAMLCIADSRFQPALLATAKKYAKLATDWKIPAEYSNNTPKALQARFARCQQQLPEWPFGSDFNAVELRLIKALGWLKAATSTRLATSTSVLSAFTHAFAGQEFVDELSRMDLLVATGLQQKLYRRLLLMALHKTAQTR